jgi:hypothetical protein
MPFQIVQIFYWLALSAWFGGVLFVMLAAQVVVRTAIQAKPILPNILAVNLENEHGTVLGGSIMGNLLAMLGVVQSICAAVVLVATVLQFFLIDLSGNNLTAMYIRIALLILAAAAGGYDRYVLWPRIIRYRDEFIAHADEPEIANPAKDHFDREQRNSLNLLMMLCCLLTGLVLFSANISPSPSSKVVQVGK